MSVDVRKPDDHVAEAIDSHLGNACECPAPKVKPKDNRRKVPEPPLKSAPYTEQEKRAMKTPLSTFAQVVTPLRLIDLDLIAKKHDANKGTKKFKAEAHLKTMLFAHLSGSASLRELEIGFEVFRGEINHLGMPYAPTRTTIAYANEHRNWEYFMSVYYGMLKYVSRSVENSVGGLRRKFKFKDKLFLIDSTTIDLCHSMFDWAEFRATKGGVKVHLMLEHATCLPVWVHVTEAKHHDQKILETVDPVASLPKGSFVCMDRAYNDFEMLHLWNTRGVNFVCRAKSNMAYEVVGEREVPNPVGRPLAPGREVEAKSHVVKDQIIRLAGTKSRNDYPEELRMVTFWIEEKKGARRVSREVAFFTNNFKLSSATIAEIYKSRWQIEAFFKLIKQNLKLKSFLGTSANAVKIQVYAAMIAILLLMYLKSLCMTGWCVPHLLAVIRLTLYKHRHLLHFLNRERPNSPPKPGQRLTPFKPTMNKLF
jgi:hypothetical protein